MPSNYNGQVIQIARGNLISRLKGTGSKAAKALAFGELFIHTGEKQNVSSYHIKDLVTNSELQTIFTGDLFAGHNTTKEVYFLGSGGSLKWGGIVFSAQDYEELVAKAKENPEHIFMYNGATSVSPKNNLYNPKNDPNDSILVNDKKSIVDGETDPNQIAKLDRSYVAKSSTEWQLRINPGDLLFYSSALDQIVVIHLSRSTDALTKINVDELVSGSMQLWLAEELGATVATETEEINYDKIPSTLKTFLDGPVRHYQYLVDNKGWKPAEVVTECTIERPNQESTDTAVTVINGTVRLPDPHDGEIYYVPFSTTNLGYNKYKVVREAPTDGVLLEGLEDVVLREGDLLFALPQSDGGVRFATVSLYGAILDKFRFDKTITRADKYATDIWKIGIGGENGYEGDHKYQVEHDNISDFIDRLFTTKVDIDPTTGKIISSQLPDFLLGAPKYMGHFENPLSDWENLTAETTAEDFAKNFLLAEDWENLDKSEDDADGTSENNETDSAKVNNLLKTGCYWIYQGDTVDISKYPGIFHTCADEDDYTSGEVEAELAAEVDALQATVDNLSKSITEKTDSKKKADDYLAALKAIQGYLLQYKDNTKPLEEFKAAVMAAAAAEGITYEIVPENPEADISTENVAINITTDTSKVLETAITDQESTVLDIQTSIETDEDSKAEAEAELTEKSTRLNTIRSKLQQHLLNKGDWVIYNAKVDDGIGDDNFGKFEIIDNSSSFIGILVKNTKVAGVAEFKNAPKDLAYTKAWKTDNAGRIEDRRVQRTADIDISAANNSIAFQNEDKVFAAGPDFLDTNFLPRIAGERTDKGNVTLINSRFMLLEEIENARYRAGLGVNFPTGYKDVKDMPESAALLWHYAIPTEKWVNNHEVEIDYYSFKDEYNYKIKGANPSQENAYIVTTKTRTDVDANGVVTATGLNFDWIPFMGTVLDHTQFYSFAITHEVSPKLYLPSHSGVLATEKYVNQGFTVVKAIFNDLYEKLLRMTTRGHVDWLQTIRTYEEDEWIDPRDPSKGTQKVTRNEICDSRVLQERSEDSFVLKLFYEQNDITDPYMEYNKAKFNHQISAYQKIAETKAAELAAKVDYYLGSGDPGATPVRLNPSVPQAGDLQPEQVLPNHSGIILNNNSVIDGGEW